jgi:hypothetical protein
MSRVGFEPTIPVFERAKTIHALDAAATAIGCYMSTNYDLIVSLFNLTQRRVTK